MSVKAMDQVFSRWFLDGDFRAKMNQNPELALAGYDLSEVEQQKLSSLSRKHRRANKSAAKARPAKSPSLPAKIQYQLPQPGQYFNLN